MNWQFSLINKKRRRFLGLLQSHCLGGGLSCTHTAQRHKGGVQVVLYFSFAPLSCFFCSLELQISLARSLTQRSSKVQVNSGRGQSVELRCGG